MDFRTKQLPDGRRVAFPVKKKKAKVGSQRVQARPWSRDDQVLTCEHVMKGENAEYSRVDDSYVCSECRDKHADDPGDMSMPLMWVTRGEMLDKQGEKELMSEFSI